MRFPAASKSTGTSAALFDFFFSGNKRHSWASYVRNSLSMALRASCCVDRIDLPSHLSKDFPPRFLP